MKPKHFTPLELFFAFVGLYQLGKIIEDMTSPPKKNAQLDNIERQIAAINAKLGQ